MKNIVFSIFITIIVLNTGCNKSSSPSTPEKPATPAEEPKKTETTQPKEEPSTETSKPPITPPKEEPAPSKPVTPPQKTKPAPAPPPLRPAVEPPPAEVKTETCDAICELEKNGIKVSAYRRNFMLPKMEELKEEIIKMKSMVKEVSDDLKDYDYKTQRLYVHEFTTPADLIALRDMINYSKQLGIEIHDHLFKSGKWEADKKFLQKHMTAILAQKQFISSIEFWNVNCEYDISGRRLWLRNDSSTKNLQGAMKDVAKFGPAALKFKDLKLDTGEKIGLNNGLDDVVALARYSDQFLKLTKEMGTKTITFNGAIAFCKMGYDDVRNIIYIYSLYSKDCNISQMLTNFREAFLLQTEIHIPITEKYGARSYIIEVSPSIENMKFIKKYKKDFIARNNAIKKIKFEDTPQRPSRFSQGTLEISWDATHDHDNGELVKLMAKIPVN